MDIGGSRGARGRPFDEARNTVGSTLTAVGDHRTWTVNNFLMRECVSTILSSPRITAKVVPHNGKYVLTGGIMVFNEALCIKESYPKELLDSLSSESASRLRRGERSRWILHCRKEVDMIERLPTPFGLVRYGVAPDHPETKIVINQFSRVALNERCSFFGNVNLGISVSLSELREIYHVVVLAYGAESDRTLGIPGEDLAGIHSAREFVWWYNGHPDCSYMSPDLKSTDTAIVLGQGNVALDVARILLRPTTELATTDIAEHALISLQNSSIRKVCLVGRRGPVQAACTAKELREILGLKDLYINVQEHDLVKSHVDEEELKNSRIQRRVYELLCKAATSRPPQPVSENGTPGKQSAIGTGQFEDHQCGLVLKSIGYRSVPVEGLPFDDSRGVVPNINGRVLSDKQHNNIIENGLYVSGWLKRGPTGIIATNLYDAEETVASISEDLEGVLADDSNSPRPGRDGLLQLLDSRSVRYVPFKGWEEIDLKEKAIGAIKNKPREKIASPEELLRAANT
ncbi:hypothetical protein QJS04_geneDACA019408 [Acorus gramineus]|uniref:NADPH:adrenodoxin oxidoreductase, mitochondrial n=1 Tax=Acorus gramineus TaxID=55184 RepID=A0AAV9AM83_ACOGR|nr:hypothetical protein QJS04_geneDACA019408 [Acorus gramineus]